jgi:hypothetical protein
VEVYFKLSWQQEREIEASQIGEMETREEGKKLWPKELRLVRHYLGRERMLASYNNDVSSLD